MRPTSFLPLEYVVLCLTMCVRMSFSCVVCQYIHLLFIQLGFFMEVAMVFVSSLDKENDLYTYN